MAGTFTEVFRDDFDNGTVDLSTDLGNGAVTEASGHLRVTCTSGFGCNWWSGAIEDAPVAYTTVASHVSANSLWRSEIKIDASQEPVADVHLGLAVWQDRDNVYFFGWHGASQACVIDKIVSDVGSGHLGVKGGDKIATRAHYYRVYVNETSEKLFDPDLKLLLGPNTITFCEKIDNGEWRRIHSRALEFTPDRVGIFSKRWTGTSEVWAEADYLSIEEFTASSSADTYTEKLNDDFTNSTVDLSTDLGTGTISESGTLLTLTSPIGVNSDWWSGAAEDAPIAYTPVLDHLSVPGLLKVEAKLAGLSPPTTNECIGGLCIYQDRDNAYHFGWYENFGLIELDTIISDTGTARVFSASVTNPNSDAHTYRAYINKTPKTLQDPDTGRHIAPGSVAFFYKLDSGSWLFAHELALDFSPVNVGLFFKKWSSSSETASVSFDYLAAYELTYDTAPTVSGDGNPATTFSETSLPQQWTPRLCHVAPYAANTLTYLSPGLQLSAPTLYTVPNAVYNWIGLVASGWGFGLYNGDQSFLDVELAWENFTLDATPSSPGETSQFGLALEIPYQTLLDSSPNGVANVFVGRHRDSTVDQFIVSAGRAPGHSAGSATVLASVSYPGGLPEDRVRLVRGDLDTWSAFYHDGTSWVELIGSFSLSSVVGGGHEASLLETYCRPALRAFYEDASAWPTVDLTEFKVNEGYVTIGDPSEDFDDGVRDPSRVVHYERDSIRYPVASNEERVGGLQFLSSYTVGSQIEGVYMPGAFLPGTDIDVTFSMDFEVNVNANQAVKASAYFENCLQDNKGHSGFSKKQIEIEFEWRPPNYFLGSLWQADFQVYNDSISLTSIGNVSESFLFGGALEVKSKSVRLTRTGNVWKAYDGVTLIGTWTDTGTHLTDWPVTLVFETRNAATGNYYALDPRWRITDIEIASGDTDPGLPPIAPPGPVVPEVVAIPTVKTSAETGLLAFAAPLTFLSTGDMIKHNGGRVTSDTAKAATMILQNGIPLTRLGSLVPVLPFEPNDGRLGAVLQYHIRKALNAGSEFITVSKVQIIQNSNNTVTYRCVLKDSRQASQSYVADVISTEHGWLMNINPPQ